MQNKKNEVLVGIFMLTALAALLFISLRVANLKAFSTEQLTWKIYATFDNIGGLRVSSPVKIGGVVIGRVTDIVLDKKSLLPVVTIAINNKYANKIPDTSSLSIRTQGLLGEQFLELNLGFTGPELGSVMLKDGEMLHDTKSIVALEDLLGQFLYKNCNDKK